MMQSSSFQGRSSPQLVDSVLQGSFWLGFRAWVLDSKLEDCRLSTPNPEAHKAESPKLGKPTNPPPPPLHKQKYRLSLLARSAATHGDAAVRRNLKAHWLRVWLGAGFSGPVITLRA